MQGEVSLLGHHIFCANNSKIALTTRCSSFPIIVIGMCRQIPSIKIHRSSSMYDILLKTRLLTIFRVNVAICETGQLLLPQSTLFSCSVCFSLRHASIVAQTNVNICARLFGLVCVARSPLHSPNVQ